MIIRFSRRWRCHIMGLQVRWTTNVLGFSAGLLGKFTLLSERFITLETLFYSCLSIAVSDIVYTQSDITHIKRALKLFYSSKNTDLLHSTSRFWYSIEACKLWHIWFVLLIYFKIKEPNIKVEWAPLLILNREVLEICCRDRFLSFPQCLLGKRDRSLN